MTPKKGKIDYRKAKGMLPPDEYRLTDDDMYKPPGIGLPVEEEEKASFTVV